MGGHGPQRERPQPSLGGDRSHPASGTAGLGPAGRGGLGGDCQGRGPLPGPWWVGQRPPGSGCEARPLVAATINMFVQGKPGWEPCALAWGGRKGRLCLAHWADCLCSRNCCPVAGKVRRPSGPVGSNRCLGPLCSLPAVACASPAAPLGLGTGREGARKGLNGGPAKAKGEEKPESSARPGQPLGGQALWPQHLGRREPGSRAVPLGARSFTGARCAHQSNGAVLTVEFGRQGESCAETRQCSQRVGRPPSPRSREGQGPCPGCPLTAAARLLERLLARCRRSPNLCAVSTSDGALSQALLALPDFRTLKGRIPVCTSLRGGVRRHPDPGLLLAERRKL